MKRIRHLLRRLLAAGLAAVLCGALPAALAADGEPPLYEVYSYASPEEFMELFLGVDEGLNLVIQEQERLLGDEGRVLVRASGTEPVIRVMVEGKDQELIGACAQKIAQTIEERLANNESCKQLEEF